MLYVWKLGEQLFVVGTARPTGNSMSHCSATVSTFRNVTNTHSENGAWRDVGDVATLAVGEIRQLNLDTVAVVLVRTVRGIAAFQGVCSHEAYPMADGYLEDDRFVCAMHGSSFDALTGTVRVGPAEEPLARYEVRIVEQRIQLFVPESGLPVND